MMTPVRRTDTWQVYCFLALFSVIVYALCWSSLFHFDGSSDHRLQGTELTKKNLSSANNTKFTSVKEQESRFENILSVDDLDIPQINRKIVLLTYYRGGSTFLGEIFAQNPDVFYWFEPLRGLLGNIYGNLGEYKPRINHFFNVEDQYRRANNKSLIEMSRDSLWNRSRVLDAVCRCDVDSLPRWLLDDSFVKGAAHMPKMRPFSACLRFARNTRNTDRCRSLLEDMCFLFPVVVVKTIRYPLYGLEQLFSLIPDAHVIYYVRDPRGIMSSRKNLHHFRSAHLSIFAQNLCDAMLKNHEHFLRLKRLFPDRLINLRYEDLAYSPLEVAHKLYSFTGLRLPQDVIRWIRQNTAAHRATDPFATRRNSSQTAVSWKMNLTGKEKQTIENKCKEVIKIYGYSD